LRCFCRLLDGQNANTDEDDDERKTLLLDADERRAATALLRGHIITTMEFIKSECREVPYCVELAEVAALIPLSLFSLTVFSSKQK
jgi:hypothetical protein